MPVEQHGIQLGEIGAGLRSGAAQLLGKPGDRGEAAQMLRSLSGRTRQVIIGACMLASSKAPLSTTISAARGQL